MFYVWTLKQQNTKRTNTPGQIKKSIKWWWERTFVLFIFPVCFFLFLEGGGGKEGREGWHRSICSHSDGDSPGAGHSVSMQLEVVSDASLVPELFHCSLFICFFRNVHYPGNIFSESLLEKTAAYSWFLLLFFVLFFLTYFVFSFHFFQVKLFYLFCPKETWGPHKYSRSCHSVLKVCLHGIGGRCRIGKNQLSVKHRNTFLHLTKGQCFTLIQVCSSDCVFPNFLAWRSPEQSALHSKDGLLGLLSRNTLCSIIIIIQYFIYIYI